MTEEPVSKRLWRGVLWGAIIGGAPGWLLLLVGIPLRWDAWQAAPLAAWLSLLMLLGSLILLGAAIGVVVGAFLSRR
jgi:hypothetical protein